jgi:hypothetical protein
MFRFAAVVASDSRGVCEIGAQPLDGQTRWLRTAVSYWLKNGYHVSAPHFPHAVLLARPRTVAESHIRTAPSSQQPSAIDRVSATPEVLR